MTFQNMRMLDESDAISDGRTRTLYDIGSSPDSDRGMFNNLGRGLRLRKTWGC